MTMQGVARKLMWAGLGLVLLSNLVMLVRIWDNRRGQPESVMTLTERELNSRGGYSVSAEDSGLSLSLEWRECQKPWNSDESECPPFLDEVKMNELGFRNLKPGQSLKGRLPKDVFLALELDGSSYAQALKFAEKKFEKAKKSYALSGRNKEDKEVFDSAERDLTHARVKASRLFVIDASCDAETLRKKHPDRSRVMILKGRVEPYVRTEGRVSRITGTIDGLCAGSIHVSQSRRAFFDTLKEHTGDDAWYTGPPRYAVTLAVGKRFEPYILSVRSL